MTWKDAVKVKLNAIRKAKEDVYHITTRGFQTLADCLGEGYPYTLAQKIDVLYRIRLWGYDPRVFCLGGYK